MQSVTYNIPEELRDIIPAYLDRRGEDVAKLYLDIAAGDFESIMKVAHKLIGNGSSFGFDKITLLGDMLTQAARQEDTFEVKRLIQEFDNEIQKIKFILES